MLLVEIIFSLGPWEAVVVLPRSIFIVNLNVFIGLDTFN